MAAENNLWTTLRPRLLTAGFFPQRIETSTNEGVPDVWIGLPDRRYLWVELKAIREWPVRDTTQVFGRAGLSVEQVGWLLAATGRGVQALIFAGVGVGHARRTFEVPAALAETFNGMNKVQLARFERTIPEFIKNLRG